MKKFKNFNKTHKISESTRFLLTSHANVQPMPSINSSGMLTLKPRQEAIEEYQTNKKESRNSKYFINLKVDNFEGAAVNEAYSLVTSPMNQVVTQATEKIILLPSKPTLASKLKRDISTLSMQSKLKMEAKQHSMPYSSQPFLTRRLVKRSVAEQMASSARNSLKTINIEDFVPGNLISARISMKVLPSVDYKTYSLLN